MSVRPVHVVPPNHPWSHNLVLRSCAEEARADERERVHRVEAALSLLAEKVARVECLDELERDEARDQALCQAVVRSAAGPRRLMAADE